VVSVEDEYGRTVHTVLAQRKQCLVGPIPRIRINRDGQIDVAGHLQEGVAIVSGIGRDAAERAFLEKVALVFKGWNVTEMDSGNCERATAI